MSSPYSNDVNRRRVYPTFLSFGETAKLHGKWALMGFVDASRWDIVVKVVIGDAEIRSNVLKSTLLNSLSLISIHTFNFFILPLLSRSPSNPHQELKWVHRNFHSLFQLFWLVPVVGLSLYLNITWSSLVARRTWVLQYGRKSALGATSYSGMLTAIATSAYRVILIASSIFLTFIFTYIPFFGSIASFVFMCWVDSYYCFEFIWIARGTSLSQRVKHLEERWAYYFAFGFPSAFLCAWSSPLSNAALFALVFPSYIIMSHHAHPLPSTPYTRTPPSPTSTSPIYPSPYIPIRLPIFAPVIFMNDLVVRILTVGGGGKVKVRRDGDGEGEGEGVEEGINLGNLRANGGGERKRVLGRKKMY